MKPIIGITSNHSDDDQIFIEMGIGGFGQEYSIIANDYSDAIIKAGGIPVIIPISEDEEYLKELADNLDGLIISGGNDVDPLLYNKIADEHTGLVSPKRDNQELFLLDYFYKNTNKPILGMCRGMQLINVYFNGTLILDIPSSGYRSHSINIMDRTYPVHSVKLKKDSLLSKIMKAEETLVNSLHHQGIDKLGESLVDVAISEDGIIEAFEIENISDRFLLGIQWHAENTSIKFQNHQNIFDYFVEVAIKNK